MGIERVGDIDISEDLTFQRRSWRAQRAGWAAMAAVLAAALLGVLGPGVVSDARAGGAEAGLEVDYLRFLRHRAPERLQIRVLEGAVNGETARIAIDRDYLSGITIETVYPEPDSVEASPDELTYVFELEGPGATTTITFRLQHDAFGLTDAAVALDGEAPVRFWQLVYP